MQGEWRRAPSRLPPALTYAYVRLLDTLTNLLTQASNSVASQIVGLTNMVLPSAGTYRIRISAPANHSASTGNYRVTVLDTSAPVIAAQPTNQLVLPGATAQFNVTVSGAVPLLDRKSTRLNSSHLGISYAVFC